MDTQHRNTVHKIKGTEQTILAVVNLGLTHKSYGVTRNYCFP